VEGDRAAAAWAAATRAAWAAAARAAAGWGEVAKAVA